MKTCHLWRNYEDIQDSWESVTKILNYYGDNQNSLIPLAGPGHWNDPDMVNIETIFKNKRMYFYNCYGVVMVFYLNSC